MQSCYVAWAAEELSIVLSNVRPPHGPRTRLSVEARMKPKLHHLPLLPKATQLAGTAAPTAELSPGHLQLILGEVHATLPTTSIAPQ